VYIFDIDQDFDPQEKDLIDLFKQSNLKVNSKNNKYDVLWMKEKGSNPEIIFSNEQLQGYMYLIKRIDGLNFYFFM